MRVLARINSVAGGWRLKKALNGARKACQGWAEHCANVAQEWDGERKAQNPANRKEDGEVCLSSKEEQIRASEKKVCDT